MSEPENLSATEEFRKQLDVIVVKQLDLIEYHLREVENVLRDVPDTDDERYSDSHKSVLAEFVDQAISTVDGWKGDLQ